MIDVSFIKTVDISDYFGSYLTSYLSKNDKFANPQVISVEMGNYPHNVIVEVVDKNFGEVSSVIKITDALLSDITTFAMGITGLSDDQYEVMTIDKECHEARVRIII